MRKRLIRWPIKVLQKKSNNSDRLLLRKASSGDSEAFGKLYLKYLDSIYRHIYFRVNQRREDAEDLTEIVFFKAWDHMRNYHVNGKSFKAWIYTIAHNAVIDHYRKSKKLVALSDAIVDSKPQPMALVLRDEENNYLAKALNGLTQEQKRVITLKFIEGIENREIAKILSKNEIAVRALQHRALIKLKKILAGKL